MKKCGKCQIIKEDFDFFKSALEKSGGICRPCNAENARIYKAKNIDKVKVYTKTYSVNYYKENIDKILENKKEYYEENKEEILQERKDFYQKIRDKKLLYNKSYYQENKETIIIQNKNYALNNIENVRKYRNTYFKNLRKASINFRIRTSISANINIFLKSNNSSKAKKSTLKYLTYTIDELKAHLESLFESWMTWDNYGKYETDIWDDNDQSTWKWQIDHIIPHSTFKYTSMEDDEFKQCWSFDNLRPYSAKQNFMDGVRRTRH